MDEDQIEQTEDAGQANITSVSLGDDVTVHTDTTSSRGTVLEINAHWIVLDQGVKGAVVLGQDRKPTTAWVQTKFVRAIVREAAA